MDEWGSKPLPAIHSSKNSESKKRRSRSVLPSGGGARASAPLADPGDPAPPNISPPDAQCESSDPPVA